MTPAAFTLFVAGQSENTQAVIERLQRFCAERLTLRASFLVVDVLKSPAAAEASRITATPTLVKHAPGPERRVVGELEDVDGLIDTLELRHATRHDPQRVQAFEELMA